MTAVPPRAHCRQPITTTDGVIYIRYDDTIRSWHTDRPTCWAAALQAGRAR